ncbi:glycoside hydrolase family 47 protein [Macroventuria anomochaeta]|uniref:Glycoside hydrolase family 47 protein n=1 Tax=Macroventuria anomochaeta TaxID=301207 RepID=A0ACB6S4E1_9PLEO|nr:glycoside hydrolase family 47 protein [Macroventuria anomochaeta]KAF2628238.1 glycoside hydrolase family 47 protein [Macroventuria anomochaeta]
MVRPSAWALSAVLLPVVSALPANAPWKQGHDAQGKRQYYSPPVDRAQAVIDTFKLSWEGYYKHAFPNDELHPVTNTFGNSRNGWGASAADALSTALIMGEREIVNQIISYIPTIDWSVTSTSVSLFETTIRYLGGMLSGYDFLSGPLAHLADNPAHVDALLEQSVNLANNLSYAFQTPSGVPYNLLNLSTRDWIREPNGLATVGTLILEWTRLSDLTGNSSYASLVDKAESCLLSPSPASSEPFPGLLGTDIDPTTGAFLDARGGWIGGTDSFYEYLIKMWVYDPSRYEVLRERWEKAADSTITYLASRPLTCPDLTFVTTYNGTELQLTSEHLACFDGGNFILGGQVLGSSKYLQFGLSLVDGCHATYASTATHIGPEVFGWDPSLIPAGQEAFFAQNGFYILRPGYQLRPEVIESYYYAYRATGDTKYQDWAWDAFVAVNATTRVGSGYSTIRDVNVAGGGGFEDMMESFWFAEVLKYSYLIQVDDDAPWQVSKAGNNKWVWNTEAHPVRVYGQ